MLGVLVASLSAPARPQRVVARPDDPPRAARRLGARAARGDDHRGGDRARRAHHRRERRGSALVTRLLDTGIGIAVGLLINLLVWPPLRDRSAAAPRRRDRRPARRAAERHGGDAARRRRHRRGRRMDRAHRRARQRHRQGLGRRAPGARERQAQPAPRRARPHEGYRGLRRAARAPRAGGRRHPQHGPHDLAGERPARALGPAPSARPGSTCSNAPARRSATPIRMRSEPCARTSTRSRASSPSHALPDGFWPVAGALLVNLRNILASLDVVADAQPVQVPAPALAGGHPSVRSRL